VGMMAALYVKQDDSGHKKPLSIMPYFDFRK
jgi:hypothetical protein